MRLRTIAWLLVAILPARGAASGGEGKEVPLEPKGLAGVFVTLTPTDVKGGYIPIDEGSVRPSTKITFPKDAQSVQALEIGPHEGEVLCDRRKKRFVLKLGSETYELAEAGAGLKPVLLDLPDGGKAALVFPAARHFGGGSLLYYRSGYTMRGELGGAKVHLYDDNLDLRYEPGTDTVRVGDGLVFAKLAEQISLGKTICTFAAVDPAGASFSAVRYTGEAGSLTVKYDDDKRRRFDCAFASADGKLVFTSAENGEAYAVTPGAYNVTHGLVWREKGGQPYALAGIVPGDSTAVEVGAGGKAEIAIGEDIELVFKPTVGSNQFGISVSTLKVVGKHGEEYVGYSWEKAPDVYVVDGGKAKKVGGFEYG